MAPWESKMRWKPGGNYQSISTVCELEWTKCVYAIGNYLWTEIYVDVIEFLNNHNEEMIFKITLILFIFIIFYLIIRWRVQKAREKMEVKNFINQLSYEIQNLELRIDILSYKIQHGTWPSFQQIKKIEEIEKIKSEVRLSVSDTNNNNNKSNKNVWLKNFLSNNYIKLKSSSLLLGKFPRKSLNKQQFQPKIEPKIPGNINFNDQTEEDSEKELKIITNNILHNKDVEILPNDDNFEVMFEHKSFNALNKDTGNDKNNKNEDEKLLKKQESVENIEKTSDIKKQIEIYNNNNYYSNLQTIKNEHKDAERCIKNLEYIEGLFLKNNKNVVNNVKPLKELNGISRVVQQDLEIISTQENEFPEVEKTNSNDCEVFSQPEIIFNPLKTNEISTLESALKFMEYDNENARKNSLEDIKIRLKNLYDVLKTYRDDEKLNKIELNHEEKLKKQLARAFINELSEGENEELNFENKKQDFDTIYHNYNCNSFFLGLKYLDNVKKREENGEGNEESGDDKEEHGSNRENPSNGNEEHCSVKEDTFDGKKEHWDDKEEISKDKEEFGDDKKENSNDKKDSCNGKEELFCDKKETCENKEEFYNDKADTCNYEEDKYNDKGTCNSKEKFCSGKIELHSGTKEPRNDKKGKYDDEEDMYHGKRAYDVEENSCSGKEEQLGGKENFCDDEKELYDGKDIDNGKEDTCNAEETCHDKYETCNFFNENYLIGENHGKLEENHEKFNENDIIGHEKKLKDDKSDRINISDLLMLEKHLIKVQMENLLEFNENFIGSDKALIDFQENTISDEENKLSDKPDGFFINSKSVYQSNLSDIISESDQIDETDESDEHNLQKIFFNFDKLKNYSKVDDKIKQKAFCNEFFNEWSQSIINPIVDGVESSRQNLNCNVFDFKSENLQKNDREWNKHNENLIDILDLNISEDKNTSKIFEKNEGNLKLENERSYVDDFANLEDIFMNNQDLNISEDDLIDLNDENVDLKDNQKDQNNNKKKLINDYYDIEENTRKICENIQYFESLNDCSVKNVNNKKDHGNMSKDNCSKKTGKYPLFSGKTFIKENLKRNFENQCSKDEIDVHDGKNNQEENFQCNNYKESGNLTGNISKKNSIELKTTEIIFDELSDAETTKKTLNKFLKNNNCENLSEIEFDTELEKPENIICERKENVSVNNSSEDSSLYLTGEESFSDISGNGKSLSIKLKIMENSENHKNGNEKEKTILNSQDSTIYETPQDSITIINNNNNKNNKNDNNNNNNLKINLSTGKPISDGNSSFSTDASLKNKFKSLKSPKKSEKLENSWRKSENLETPRRKLENSGNLENSWKKDPKELKSKSKDENKRNNYGEKFQSTGKNDSKFWKKDIPSTKARSNLNLSKDSHDSGQDFRTKSLEQRSKSYITPRKVELTVKNVLNSPRYKKNSPSNYSGGKMGENNIEMEKLNLFDKKIELKNKLDSDSRSRSLDKSLDKILRSNIPVLKSRIDPSKCTNVVKNSKKCPVIDNPSKDKIIKNDLSCVKGHKNLKSPRSNIFNENPCTGLCKQFNQQFIESKRIFNDDKKLVIKGFDKNKNCYNSLTIKDNQNIIYMNIVTNEKKFTIEFKDLDKFLDYIKDNNLNIGSILKDNDCLNRNLKCNCSQILSIISSCLGEKNQQVYCRQKEMEVLNPAIIDTSTSIVE